MTKHARSSLEELWDFEDQYSALAGSAIGAVRSASPRSVRSPLAAELTLYSRAANSWSMDAKAYLSERGYRFAEIDVDRNPTAYRQMRELSDQIYVPMLVVGDEVLANFDTDQLEKFLSEHGIEPSASVSLPEKRDVQMSVKASSRE